MSLFHVEQFEDIVVWHIWLFWMHSHAFSILFTIKT